MGVANGREWWRVAAVSSNGREEGGGRRWWRDAGEKGAGRNGREGRASRVNCRGGRKDQIKIKRIVKNV